jgi:hypothetical protein
VFTALLDACVLWPSLQRDFLLSLAIEGMYRPIWSSAILEELEISENAKLTDRAGMSSGEAELRARHLIEEMRANFEDAEVVGWEGLEGSYGLPDPDDEHVLAAAVVGGAGAIVTLNHKDFPRAMMPHGLEVLSQPLSHCPRCRSNLTRRGKRCERSWTVPAREDLCERRTKS